MGTIIAIANQKGGVGKTTLALHGAAYLARHGQRVVVIDADTQANASSWVLGYVPASSALYDLLVRERSWADVLRRVNGAWQIGFLAGSAETAGAMTVLETLHRPFDTVARRLAPLAKVADHVLIDMPPSRASGFLELLYAADHVLIPTQLERHSLEGVVFMAQACHDLREQHGRGPRLLGIVPNMLDRRTLLHSRQATRLVQSIGAAVWAPIPRAIVVAETAGTGRVVFDSAPGSDADRALEAFGQRLLANSRGAPGCAPSLGGSDE